MTLPQYDMSTLVIHGPLGVNVTIQIRYLSLKVFFRENLQVL
jgi:hypothetical protein